MSQGAYLTGCGDHIREIREAGGLSQRQFAKFLGIKPKSLSDIESGRRACHPELLSRIEKLAVGKQPVGG